MFAEGERILEERNIIPLSKHPDRVQFELHSYSQWSQNRYAQPLSYLLKKSNTAQSSCGEHGDQHADHTDLTEATTSTNYGDHTDVIYTHGDAPHGDHTDIPE